MYSNFRKRFVAAIPIPGFLTLFVVLLFVLPEYTLETWVFDPPWLLPPLNTIFLGFIPLMVAFIALRTYLSTGLITILLMGCAVLALGFFNLVAAWVIGRPEGTNYTPTIHNLGVLIASIFHLGGAVTTVMEDPSVTEPKRRIWWLILGYSGIPIFLTFITLLTLDDMIPAFFIQGVGPTPLRQLVLGMAIGFFAASCLLFLRFYLRKKSEFLYWYSLGLGLLAIGLIVVFFQKVIGGPIGWVGRWAQYLGPIYFLFAVLAALRSAREKHVPFEIALAGFFRKAEIHLRNLVETLGDAVISIDRNGRVLLWNDAAEKAFGYSRKESVGAYLADLNIFNNLPTDFGPAVQPHKGKRLRQQSPRLLMGSTGRRKDSFEFPVEISAAKMQKDRDVTTFIVRDITERKGAEEEIQKLNEELMKRARYLEMANQELDAFASMVSHDLKNQLVVIGSFLRRLFKQQIEKLDAKGQEYLGIVNESVGKMVTLVDDLLEFSRVSKGSIKVEKIDLSDLAGAIMNKYKEMDAGRRIQLVIKKGMKSEGDRRLLEVALDNLLGNAWKFTKHSNPALIELGVNTEMERPVFYIRDNGCGFEMPEDPERVFLPFQRFHSTDEYLGSGVGLATVKRILDRHGGRIWVQSEVGKGTTFYFSLEGVLK